MLPNHIPLFSAYITETAADTAEMSACEVGARYGLTSHASD